MVDGSVVEKSKVLCWRGSGVFSGPSILLPANETRQQIHTGTMRDRRHRFADVDASNKSLKAEDSYSWFDATDSMVALAKLCPISMVRC